MISEKVSDTYCPSREPRLRSRQEITGTSVITSKIVKNILDFSEKFKLIFTVLVNKLSLLNISNKIINEYSSL
jgi:hypothetical protein